MRQRSKSLFLMGLVVALTTSSVQARGSDRPADPNVAGFVLYFHYLIVVQATAGPLKGVNFLLDTGTNPSVISPRLGARLHLAPSPTTISVLHGTSAAGTTTLPMLEFGPIQKTNFPVLVEDLGFANKRLPVPIEGILGMDVLGQAPFVIDYENRRILFGTPAALPDSVQLELKLGLPMVDAMIDHRLVHLLLDIGAPSLILFQNQQPTPDGYAKVTPGSIGDYEQKQVWIQRLTLGRAMFTKEAAFIVPTRNQATSIFDGLMSPAALGITCASVDLPAGEFAFSRENRCVDALKGKIGPERATFH